MTCVSNFPDKYCCYGPETVAVTMATCPENVCEPQAYGNFNAIITLQSRQSSPDAPFNLITARLRWATEDLSYIPTGSVAMTKGYWWTVKETFNHWARMRADIVRATLEGCDVVQCTIKANFSTEGPRAQYSQVPSPSFPESVPAIIVKDAILQLPVDHMRMWEGRCRIYVEQEVGVALNAESLIVHDGRMYRVEQVIDINKWDRLPFAMCTYSKTIPQK